MALFGKDRRRVVYECFEVINVGHGQTFRTSDRFQVEFEDRIIKDFNTWKASGVSPFGQAPVLEVDGKPIAQTGAIARYCGKLSGHYPKDDDFAAAKIDEILDTATDMTTTMGTTMRMEDPEEKKTARAKLVADDGKMTMYFAALDKMLKDNGSTGFFVGKTMTVADIAMWRLLGWFKGGVLDGLPTDLIDKYANLSKFWNDMDANADIRAYMDSKYPPKK